ncbi:MAG TPA: DnaB-like helicase C-terminal domain-containing protein [Kofleriaceae bacterium]|jgi:replicative DNA helicase
MTARVMPHNLDAEAGVIGGVILRNDTLAQLDSLEVDDFYDLKHKVVWAAMRNLEAAQKPIDVVTLDNEIDRQGKLDALGGIAFLGELAMRVPTADNVVAYAEIVQGHSQARKLMLVANEIFERGYQPGLDVTEYVSEAVAKITRIDRSKSKRARRAHEVVRVRLAELEDLAQRKAKGEVVTIGAPSGIGTFDAEFGGYPLGDLSLIAARPAMGKTSMAMAAVDATTAAGYGAHVFSIEGGWRMYADRLISRGSGIPVKRVRAADIRNGESAHLARASVAFRDRKWLIDDEANLTATEIIRRVRKERRELGTRLVVVDYVQIIKRTKGLNENDALDEIVTAFSQAALADDIAYVVLSQLNRKVEERDDKRPGMSDLRGSGALEERPRIVVSPYRGAYYYDNPRKDVDYECHCVSSAVGKACVCMPNTEAFERLVKVLVLKNNNGAIGTVNATWHAETTEIS